MREFRPPVRRSTLRVVLALVLPIIVLVPMGILVSLALDTSQATYTIANGALIARSSNFFAGERTIRLTDVTEARVVSLRGGRRKAGTTLPGLCAGRFSYPDLGAVWQLTDCRARGVLIRASSEALPIVLSPPDPEAFIGLLRSGAETAIALPPPDRSVLRILALVTVPLSIVSIVMLSAVLLFGPGRMRYLVGDGALEVHTLFGRHRWPTAGARAKGHTPKRLLRVAGSGAPGYYTGRFRESGEATRVYATDLDRVILFEGAARVIVSPEDRVAMLRALEDEGVEVERNATSGVALR